jgi:hypothetical protein
MSKIIDFLVVVWATVIAFTAGYIAHSLFGVSDLTSALIGAAIFVLMFALIFVTVAPERIEKLRKSK